MPRRAFLELGQHRGIGCGVEHGHAAGLGGILLRAHALRQHRADDGLDTGSVVAGDPIRRPQQHRRDERLGIDQRFQLAQGEVRLLRLAGGKHGARRRFPPQGDAHAATGPHVEPRRDGVVEDELRKSVDEHPGIHWAAGWLPQRVRPRGNSVCSPEHNSLAISCPETSCYRDSNS